MLAGLVLAALVASGVAAGWFGRPGAVVLAVVSLVWLVVNEPMEGRVLVGLDSTHGLTAGDLAGVAGIVLAVVLLVLPHGD
jgi:hypothetical protein